MSDDQLQRLLADEYLAGIELHDIETLRRMRMECEAFEHRISYARRILQGRVDVLRAEVSARAGDGTLGALDHLAEVLADQGQRTFNPATARPPAALDPEELGDDADVGAPANVAALDDEELEALANRYAQQEAELSGVRRQLFDVIDRLQEQIADRYRAGSASVADLLDGT